MITVFVCCLLIWIAYEDMRRFRIRNIAIALLVLCFEADCLVRHRADFLVPHLIIAAVVLGLMLIAFSLEMLGGGDAKLLSAAVLWVGPASVMAFALTLLAFTLVYTVGARWNLLPARRFGNRMVIPFGPCVALALLAFIALRVWR